MTGAQVPFTPATPDDLARLLPAERLGFMAAASQVARDENPGINTTAALLLTIQRLITEPATEDPGGRPCLSRKLPARQRSAPAPS